MLTVTMSLVAICSSLVAICNASIWERCQKFSQLYIGSCVKK